MRSIKKWAMALGTVFALSALSATSACGHSDEEMQAKQREIDRLAKEVDAAKRQIADDQKKFSESQATGERMRDDMKKLGVDLEASKTNAANLEQALREYKQRADQLAVIEQRFRDLKTRLDKLNAVGLKVVVRQNRMVIQLPGDILFDSGSDSLKQGGKDVLQQVAEVIRADSTLSKRLFSVAGHTDNQKYPANGPFKDNWGLSLSRARTVLLFLTTKNAGLDPNRWSASGFGEYDPIAGTEQKQTSEEMKRNRRVELVLQPNVEEMINLGAIK